MLRLVFLVAIAAGSETFEHTGKMVVINKYAAIGACAVAGGQNGGASGNTTCAAQTDQATCINKDIANGTTDLTGGDTISDCVWTGCQNQTNTMIPVATGSSGNSLSGKVPLTAAHLATPGAYTTASSNATLAIWEAGFKNIAMRKAFPLVVAAAGNLHNGVYFDATNNDMYHMGVPFATPLADTNITTSVGAAPLYGIFSLDTNNDVQFTSWAAVPANNLGGSGGSSTAWNCQAAGNKVLGTGVVSTASRLAGIVLSSQQYITIDLYTGSTSCANTVIAPSAGGRSYEKVSWDAGSILGQQTSCVQSDNTSNTNAGASYSFTCQMGLTGKPEIVYTTYTNNACGTGASVGGTFSSTATAGDCVTVGSNSWKIMNPAADWDEICTSVHSGSMARIQVQSTCAATSTTAATPTVTNLTVAKMFAMSTALDTNFTGQYLKSGGELWNVGTPFQAGLAIEINTATDVYTMFMAAADGDLDMITTALRPPWQAFVPTATSAFYTQTNSGSPASLTTDVFGLTVSDAVGGDGALANGWQCTTGGAKVSSGYAANSTDFAISTGHKWITMRKTGVGSGTSCAADRTYTTGALGGVTYEKVVAGTASAAVTVLTGCNMSAAATSYTFKCTKNTAEDAWDIVYTPHTDAACGTPSTTTGAILTFTKAGKCQITSTASVGWEIQNTDSDWDAICGTAPTPPASASASASASGTTTTSDAAVAATAAALAAGAAALIL